MSFTAARRRPPRAGSHLRFARTVPARGNPAFRSTSGFRAAAPHAAPQAFCGGCDEYAGQRPVSPPRRTAGRIISQSFASRSSLMESIFRRDQRAMPAGVPELRFRPVHSFKARTCLALLVSRTVTGDAGPSRTRANGRLESVAADWPGQNQPETEEKSDQRHAKPQPSIHLSPSSRRRG